MKKIEIFTDGACSGNPGVGGWGSILRYKGKEKAPSGAFCGFGYFTFAESTFDQSPKYVMPSNT